MTDDNRKDPSYPTAIVGDPDEPQITRTPFSSPLDGENGYVGTADDWSAPAAACDEVASHFKPAESPRLAAILEKFKPAQPRSRGRPRRGEGVHEVAAALASSAQLFARADRIGNELAVATRRLQELQTNKGDVDVLDPAAMDAYLTDVVKTEAAIKMLEPALEKARAEAVKAQQAENERAFEERVRQTVTDLAPKWADGLREMTRLMNMIGGLGIEMDDLALQLNFIREQARERGRHGLALHVDTLRAAVASEMQGDAFAAASSGLAYPERNGETDAQWEDRLFNTLERLAGGQHVEHDRDDPRELNKLKARRVRAAKMLLPRKEGESDRPYRDRLWVRIATFLNIMPADGEVDADYRDRLRAAFAKELALKRMGDSDKAYNLRLASFNAMRQRRDELDDPILDAARRARVAIEAHAAPEAMKQQARQRRHDEQQLQALEHAQGEAVNLAAARARAPFSSSTR